MNDKTSAGSSNPVVRLEVTVERRDRRNEYYETDVAYPNLPEALAKTTISSDRRDALEDGAKVTIVAFDTRKSPWARPAPETCDVDPNSKEAISRDLESVQTQLDAMTRKYERLAAAAKNYVATGSGASAIYEAMEDEGAELKASAAPAESILDRKVTVCSACLCACCIQGSFYCDDYKTAGTVEKTIRELWSGNLRESSEYWFKDASTGETDYNAKSAAKRALDAERAASNGNPTHE